MKNLTRTTLATLLTALSLVAPACDAPSTVDQGLTDDNSEAQAEFRAGIFAADALYQDLKELETLYPLPAERELVDVGTFNAQTGVFEGLVGSDPYYDPEIGVVVPGFPAVTSIDAVNATLRFHVTNNNGLFRVTIDGKNYYPEGGLDYVDVDVSRAKTTSWTARAGIKNHSDELIIGRMDVDGVGAFEIAAWPIVMLYEPPTNNAETNEATFTKLSQRTSVTQIGQTQSESSSKAKFGTTQALSQGIQKLAGKLAKANPAFSVLANADNLLGTVSTSVIEGTSISSSQTFEFSHSDMLSMATSADLGPGRGDVIGFLENARLAWTMVNGDITVTLIDYGAVTYRSVYQLRADLLALRGGGQASYSGLDEATLEQLLELDPFYTGEEAPLDSPRFEYLETINIGGASITASLGYTHKTTDTQATTGYSGVVTDTQSGWLSVVGLGVSTDGKTTVKTSQSSSRSVTVGETVTSSFSLGAETEESYTVEAYYDRVFGTFALRRPGACPFFDPLHPDPSFCNDPACPCSEGEGDCDGDSQCGEGLLCANDIGWHYGLPATWDVCVSEIECPAYDPHNPNGSFCTEACPCDDGQGDCDSDNQCAPGLHCATDVGPIYGLPVGWDVCVSEVECPAYDPQNPDASFCTAGCPCSSGQGDCDYDNQCDDGLVCTHNVGDLYGLPASWDVCLPA